VIGRSVDVVRIFYRGRRAGDFALQNLLEPASYACCRRMRFTSEEEEQEEELRCFATAQKFLTNP
jgi:hypothetical protein